MSNRPPKGMPLNQHDQSLIHKLQVHQVELEMQNEMLRKAQADLQETRDRYADLFDFAPIPYITLTINGEICEANLAATALLDGDAYPLVGQQFVNYIESDDLERWLRHINAGWQMPGIYLPVFELYLKSKHKNRFSAELHCMAMDRKATSSSMRIALFDTTQRRAAAQELEHYAYFDVLTQLPNRRLFQDRLEHAVSASKRIGLYSALLFLDLDGFKALNDLHGHDAGDHVLVEIAKRLKTRLREHDTVARIGGDEFVIILECLDSSEATAVELAHEMAEKLKQVIALSFDPEGIELRCTACIGIRLFGPSTEVHNLLKQADQALYQAKRTGRNQTSFFHQTK